MRLFLSLLLIGVLIAGTVVADDDDCCPVVRKMTVRGSAQMSLTPDKAMLHFQLESQRDKLDDARAHVDSLTKVLHDAAVKHQVPEADIRTASYSIIPANDKRSRHYVRSNVVVTIRDFKVLNGFFADVIEGGLDEVGSVEFDFDSREKTNEEVLEKAAEAARSKAEMLVSKLGGKLGDPISIAILDKSDGLDEYRSRSKTSNVYVRGGRADEVAFFLDEEVGGTELSPGQITVEAEVEVTYEILAAGE